MNEYSSARTDVRLCSKLRLFHGAKQSSGCHYKIEGDSNLPAPGLHRDFLDHLNSLVAAVALLAPGGHQCLMAEHLIENIFLSKNPIRSPSSRSEKERHKHTCSTLVGTPNGRGTLSGGASLRMHKVIWAYGSCGSITPATAIFVGEQAALLPSQIATNLSTESPETVFLDTF